jgi:anti-sigma factor RsiW
VLNLLQKPWIASCHETADRLSDYVDGELAGRRLARVRRHLARCRHCQALLASLTRTLEGLRALGAGSSPPARPATVTAVLARIERDRT